MYLPGGHVCRRRAAHGQNIEACVVGPTRRDGEKKKPKGSEPLLFSPPSPASFDTYHAPRLERLGKVPLMCLS